MKRTIFRVSRSTAVISFWDIVDEKEIIYKSEKRKSVCKINFIRNFVFKVFIRNFLVQNLFIKILNSTFLIQF